VILPALGGVVRDRIRMALNGHVLVTVLLDENDEPLGDAWAELMGLPETGKTGAALAQALETEVGAFLARIEDRVLRDDEKLDEAIRRIVRQVSMEEIGKKPEVTVVVSRLQAE
jgi:ribonuclease J